MKSISRVKIVHILFISWGAEQARKDLMLAMGRDGAAETSEAAAKMLSYGVEHRDLRPPNVLWNSATSNVLLVDFERSEILKQVSGLQETSPNRKRKDFHLSHEISCRGLLTDYPLILASASFGAIRMFRKLTIHDNHHFCPIVYMAI